MKVGVLLKNPPGVEIQLRKRIALRVYKRIGFGAALMKAFARVREEGVREERGRRAWCGKSYNAIHCLYV